MEKLIWGSNTALSKLLAKSKEEKIRYLLNKKYDKDMIADLSIEELNDIINEDSLTNSQDAENFVKVTMYNLNKICYNGIGLMIGDTKNMVTSAEKLNTPVNLYNPGNADAMITLYQDDGIMQFRVLSEGVTSNFKLYTFPSDEAELTEVLAGLGFLDKYMNVYNYEPKDVEKAINACITDLSPELVDNIMTVEMWKEVPNICKPMKWIGQFAE